MVLLIKFDHFIPQISPFSDSSCIKLTMLDRPGRKKQPFRFWFPPWRSPSQPSKQPKPPSIPAQLPPVSSPPLPQVDGDRAPLPSPLLPPPLSGLTKVPSSSSSGRRELLPQDEPPRAQVDSEELADKFDEQLPTLTPLPQEEKTKTEFESEQVAETVSSDVEEPTLAQLTEEIKPGVDMETKKDSETQLKEIQEEKTKLDSEAQQLQQDDKSSPIKIPETREVTEEFRSEGEETREVTDEFRSDKSSPIKIPETREVTEEFRSEGEETLKEEVSEVLKKISKPKISIKVSDSDSPGRITEQETPEETESTNGGLKGTKRQKSTLKERKITISTLPKSSSQNLGQPNMQKELKDGLSRLVQKLSIGHQNKLGNEQGLNIITIASENQGASMFIGHETHPGKKVGKSNETREEKYRNVKGNQSIVASINSNVQGINSSILQETNYSERNPGVHMTISTKATVPVSFTGKTEAQKATSSLTSPQKPQKATYEPSIRRRCLRGLFLESSEDDTENPQKSRRHGCRFRCDDKKKGMVEEVAL